MTTIRVKDITGDTEIYVADDVEILENGDLCITCGSKTTVYNADHVIFHTIDDGANDDVEIYSSEALKHEYNNI